MWVNHMFSSAQIWICFCDNKLFPFLIFKRLMANVRISVCLIYLAEIRLPCLVFLKTKLLQKISSWEGCWLSKAGKETLLKSVAQALPSYAMSVFLIPLLVCQDLERLMSRFWWNSTHPNKRPIHWQKWGRISFH